MARYYEDFDIPSVRAMSDAAADAAEKQRIRQMQAVAKTSNMSALEQLQQGIAESKSASAKAQENIELSKIDYRESQVAAADAATAYAEAVTTQAEAALANAKTPEEIAAAKSALAAARGATDAAATLSGSSASLAETDANVTLSQSGGPKAGDFKYYKASKPGFRIPVYYDGKGGEYEGPEEVDPDYKSTDGEPSTYPKAGTILRYRSSRAGYRIPIIADGKGGEYEGAEQVDPDYKPSGSGKQFVEYEYNSDFTKRRAKYFDSATGAFSYGEWEDNPKTKADYDKEQAAASSAAAAMQEKRDAFALIEATMRSYGFTDSELKEILKFIQDGLIDPNMGPNQLTLALRQLPAYKARFFGNEERRARGLDALSEADYLSQEKDYSATFRQRGLQRFATRGQFATLIGNDISNTEVGKRIDIAVERVQYGDPQVLKQLKTYYNITENDIAAYYLNPKEVLPELEAKTTTAEIGSAAVQYGLSAERERAEGLRAFGVDLTRARAGYGLISERLPRTQQLSNIYSQAGIDYTQTTAEEEEFKGTASAKRAREKLKELEIGSFMRSSGTGRTSLSKGTAGLI